MIDEQKPVVICDTNIWYGLANNSISTEEIEGLHLVGTAINIIELANPEKLLNNLQLVTKAIDCFFKHTSNIILEYIPEYLQTLFILDAEPDNSGINYYLMSLQEYKNIDPSKLKIFFFQELIHRRSENIRQLPDEITQSINDYLPEVRNYFKSGKGKNAHRNNPEREVVAKKWFISLLRTFIENDSLDVSDKNAGWKNVELFRKTMDAYLMELEVSKAKFRANDIHDLFNLLYVKPGEFYWTKEKKWNRIIKENDNLKNYLL